MNYKVPVNLYLVISSADIDRLSPLLRIFVAQMLGHIIEKMEFEDGADKAGSRSTSISETSRSLLPRTNGLSKGANGSPIPGDMLIFTAGNPSICG